jgi:STE24 endopeptidase
MNGRTVCGVIFFLALFSFRGDGQEVSPPPRAAVISSENPASFDPAAATQAWLDTVPPEQRAKSDAYFEGGYWLILWNFLLSAGISIFLLESRISARLRDRAERPIAWKKIAGNRLIAALQNGLSRAKRWRWLQVVLYVIPYGIIVAVLSFPLTVYQGFYREHKYGLATQTFRPWFLEQLQMAIIALIAASVTLVILYAVFRRAPRTWWIWGTIVAVCLSMFGSFISPVYVEPIFNTYKPLEDPLVRDPILAMARANQIPVQQVFVVDASRQTTRVSANVAGLFGTTRIALNDNLLKTCTLPEIREVMAHEMGHYILNHGGKLNTYIGIFYLVGFALASWLFNMAARKWGQRWSVRDVADVAGLPLLALIVGALFFVATPLINTVVRVTEREADAFGINTAREPDGMAKVALKLGQYRKLDPNPIEEFIFYDHPSGRVRIRMAMDWKATQLPCGDVGRK